MLVKIGILFAIIGLSSCATWQAYTPPVPEAFAGKEGCYIKEVNDVVPFGTVLRPLGYCYRISCGPKVISYASCGKIINHNPRCFVSKIDVTKPHPDCCPHLICEDTNNNV